MCAELTLQLLPPGMRKWRQCLRTKEVFTTLAIVRMYSYVLAEDLLWVEGTGFSRGEPQEATDTARTEVNKRSHRRGQDT